MLIIWALVGAAIGIFAAKARGLSLAEGLVGGALLGPLAFLLFFVSGTTDTTKKRCPYCDELVQRDARVCKHCGRDISPLRKDQP